MSRLFTRFFIIAPRFTRTMSLQVKLTAPNGKSWTQPTGLFINNEFVAAENNATLETVDPCTEVVITSVSSASATDIDKAVKAAYAAFKSSEWKTMASSDRGHLMAKLADKVEENAELIATIEAWDNGKTYADALATDLTEAIGVLRYYAGWCDKIHGQTLQLPNKLAYTLRQPIGVVGQIIPWNYPFSMATWKLGPALACGNTVVLKAAEQTPLSILFLGQLIKNVGFPAGVVNFVNGLGKEAGAALAEHPLLDKVAFTGSTSTAKHIMTSAAKTLKNITLETGGKSPLVVFEDADMEQTINWSHMGIMSNQGQICTATSRLLVQKSIYKEFVDKFVARVKSTSILGTQWDIKTYQGPQVSKAQKDRVLEYIKIGKDAGAKVAIGGGVPSHLPKGYFVEPTVFIDVKPDMAIFQEEIFGPVVIVVPFETEEEAIQIANDSCYGLGAAVFTKDIVRGHKIASEIEAGMVWINSTQDCDPRVPFGGVKQSGIGRELGEAGLEAYSQIKAIHVNLGNVL